MESRIIWFQLLGFVTTLLSITAAIIAIYEQWRAVAGMAVLGCLIYQIRIWLIRPLIK